MSVGEVDGAVAGPPGEDDHEWETARGAWGEREARAIRRILVCVDRSAFSERCLPAALAVARSLGSAITLLHVMQPPNDGRLGQTTDAVDWEIARQEARVYLERLQQDATKAAGRRVDIRLEQGHPAERIASVARELDVDLTILGSQGEHDGAAWSLGSTVQQVLAVTRGSVFIVRGATVYEASPKRILVPLDGSLRTESVLPTVVRMARAHASEILLATVVDEPVPTAILSAPDDLQAARLLATRLEANAKRYLDGLRDQLVREGAAVRTVVLRSTDGKQSLLELSERERSELIVLSAHGSTCNPALTFGSLTGHMLIHSAVPLLVLQDLRHSELRGQPGDRHAPAMRASFPPEGA